MSTSIYARDKKSDAPEFWSYQGVHFKGTANFFKRAVKACLAALATPGSPACNKLSALLIAYRRATSQSADVASTIKPEYPAKIDTTVEIDATTPINWSSEFRVPRGAKAFVGACCVCAFHAEAEPAKFQRAALEELIAEVEPAPNVAGADEGKGGTETEGQS